MRRAFASMLLALGPLVANAAPSGFAFCGPDGDVCDLIGRDGYVTFGAGTGSCDVSALTCSAGYTTPVRVMPSDNFYVVCRLALFGSVDPAPGETKACYFQEVGALPPVDPVAPGEFNWNSTAHLLQAVLVMGHVFMLWIGFRAGDKV